MSDMTEEENFCKKMAKATRGRHAISDTLVNAKLAFGKEHEDTRRTSKYRRYWDIHLNIVARYCNACTFDCMLLKAHIPLRDYKCTINSCFVYSSSFFVLTLFPIIAFDRFGEHFISR